MLNNITIGQYFPGTSPLHRLDPRVKIILLFILLIEIFIFDSALSYLVLTLFTIGLMLISAVPLKMILRSLKPLSWIIIFTFIIHLFSHPGTEIAKVWLFTLTKEGVEQAVLISLRLILLLINSSLLTYTTSPLKLTDALESLLSPLKKIGVPAHELAMMMTIALRFVPTLIEETDKIMKAQQSRGADFSSGNILARLKSMIPILVPLFLSAFRRADDLAMAMEARCYCGGVGRTQMKTLKVSSIDYLACMVLVVLTAALTYIDFWV